ncbi:MAG: hypothetical protein H7Y86_06280 [Rhizobacter sp.]|nr:hypothetical protein [Ferruginibacter sp.]
MKHLLLSLFLLLTIFYSNAQNVGIGTAAPAEKLHVTGNIKSDTIKVNGIKLPPDAGEGKILTSDAAGNASWQDGGRIAGNIGYGVWGDCATNASISEFQPVVDSVDEFDRLGQCVAISGNFAVLGAPGANVNGNNGQGSAIIYEFNGSKWVFKQKIYDLAGELSDQFGNAVAIAGNYIVIGCASDNVGAVSNQGSVSIYRNNGTSWVFMQKLTDASGAAADLFGSSIAIFGNSIIAGSPGDDVGTSIDEGSASIYRFNGTFWVLVQKITDVLGAAGDRFGSSVAISATYAFAGSPSETGTAGVDDNRGSVAVFLNNGTTTPMIQRLIDDDSQGGDKFGSAIAVSGNDLIIGAETDDVLSNPAQGSVVFFKYTGSSWQQVEKFTDVLGEAGDNLGNVVAISGNYAMAGVYLDDVGANPNQGTAFLFQKVGNYWRKLQQITDPGAGYNDAFGSGVAIDGVNRRFLVGSMRVHESGGGFFGKVH